MKYFHPLTLILILPSSILWADQYNIWELETKIISSKFLSYAITFDFSRQTKIVPTDQAPQKENKKDRDSLDSPAAVAGNIRCYLKGKAIVENIEFPQDLGKIYINASLNKQAKEPPFLGEGKQYLLFNKEQKKYYYFFIERDKHKVRWNQGKTTWDTRMFPCALDFLDRMPLIFLAPLAPLGDDVFIKRDVAVPIEKIDTPTFLIEKTERMMGLSEYPCASGLSQNRNPHSYTTGTLNAATGHTRQIGVKVNVSIGKESIINQRINFSNEP